MTREKKNKKKRPEMNRKIKSLDSLDISFRIKINFIAKQAMNTFARVKRPRSHRVLQSVWLTSVIYKQFTCLIVHVMKTGRTLKNTNANTLTRMSMEIRYKSKISERHRESALGPIPSTLNSRKNFENTDAYSFFFHELIKRDEMRNNK